MTHHTLTPSEDTPLVLQVGSFNVRWDAPGDGEHRWEHRRVRLETLLHAWDPDLLGLQEPLHHQRDQILKALPNYDAVGVGRDDGVSAGEFCPILYRRARFDLAGSGTFWLSGTPATPGSVDWGSRLPRICTWASLVERETGIAFSLYNLHLDHESQTAREKGVQLLVDMIRGRPAAGPVIVTGDFNAEADNPAIGRLRAADSPVPVSALRASVPPVTLGTFHGFTGQAQGGAIDHILLSPDWEVLDAQVLPGDGARPFPSDHFPVAATLQLRGA